MPGKSIDKVLAEAERIAHVWGENPTFSMGEMKLADLNAMINGLRADRKALDDTRTLMTQQVNTVNDKALALTSMSSRLRSGIRAVFGPNSSQYDQVGGTRQSERQPRSTKKKSS